MKLKTFAIATLLTTTSLAIPAKAENLQHLQQLLSTRQCQGCELIRAGLVQADLSYVDLSGADLRGANLSRADLSGANLSGANLSGAALFGANLSGANLQGANLNGTDLRNTYLVNADLAGTNLQQTLLKGAVGLPTNKMGIENLYRWGVEEADRGNHQGAIEYYTQAIEIDPNFGQAYMDRALAQAQVGNYSQALADSTQAGEIFSSQGNTQAVLLSQRFNETMVEIQKRKAKGNGGGNGGFLNLLGSLGSLVLPFLGF